VTTVVVGKAPELSLHDEGIVTELSEEQPEKA